MSTYKRLSKSIRDFLTSALLDTERLSKAQFSGEGPVKALEKALRHEYHLPYAVAVSSATAGMEALCAATDLAPNHEVITTPFTMGATIAGALKLGCTIVFADVEEDTLCLDPEKAAQAITKHTKAFIPVDILGTPYDMRHLDRINGPHNIRILADAAESYGAQYQGVPASWMANALVTSFTAGKPLYAGEGAMILTHDAQLYHRVIMNTQHVYRQERQFPGYSPNHYAVHCRLSPIAALLALHLRTVSMLKLQYKQMQAFRIIDCLNASGLTEQITFKKKGLTPSFYRLSAAWKHKPQPTKLLAELHSHGFPVSLRNLPFGLLTDDPYLMKRYGGQVHVPHPLKIAASQIRRRFCIHIHDNNDPTNATEPTDKGKEATA
jgi:perosamine synthetase